MVAGSTAISVFDPLDLGGSVGRRCRQQALNLSPKRERIGAQLLGHGVRPDIVVSRHEPGRVDTEAPHHRGQEVGQRGG